jgi:hypothetical protein
MTTLSPEVLTDVVSNHKGFSPSGVHCQFIKLDASWGIKVYRGRKDVRDRAFNQQSAMAQVGYAPQVGESFDVGDNFCYVTQVAQPLIEGDRDGGSDYNDEFSIIEKRYSDEMFDVVDEMRQHGFYMSDVHAANFGWLNNKLICIDFGE